MIATAHNGPKGGVEYRLWSTEIGGAYRVVGKYTAWPHMTDTDKATAIELETAAREAKRAKSATEQAWREILRGG